MSKKTIEKEMRILERNDRQSDYGAEMKGGESVKE